MLDYYCLKKIIIFIERKVMGIELELISFSTFIFGMLMVVCFKALRGGYVAKEVVEQKITDQQRYKERRAFSKELENITTGFESKFASALRGELK